MTSVLFGVLSFRNLTPLCQSTKFPLGFSNLVQLLKVEMFTFRNLELVELISFLLEKIPMNTFLFSNLPMKNLEAQTTQKKQTNFVPMLPWGTGAHREVAAYRIGAFAGVPETYFIETEFKGVLKKGSLQKFIPNGGDCSEFGANKFSVDSVHRLGVLDISILNMDRNDENLLVLKTDGDWKLIPIDHTYCFPNRIDSYFNWQFWPQSKKPFSVETLAYISSINVITNTEMLIDIGIDEASVRNVLVSTLLLQKAATKGFNLFQIASMVSGKENDLVRIITMGKENEAEYYRGKQRYPLSTQLQKWTLFKNISENFIEDLLEKKCNFLINVD